MLNITMKPLVGIVGPTGIGKSRLAIKIASVCNGEIVSCDSRQVYRYMNIGTAKPSPAELAVVKHHLIDIVNPDEEISLAQYRELAYQAISDIHSQHKLPLLVGGTGQYFRAVVEGWEIPTVPPNEEMRRNLEKKAADRGAAVLYDELLKVDPVAADKIDSHNVRRVIRALEVYRSRGVPFSSLRKKSSPPYDTLIIGLTTDRKELYQQVDERVDRMIKGGLIAEVQRLIEMGYSQELPAMSGIGYKQICLYLQGKLVLDDAIRQIKFETHRYIRQQYAWFRLKDERIHWFNIGNDAEGEIIRLISNFAKSGGI